MLAKYATACVVLMALVVPHEATLNRTGQSLYQSLPFDDEEANRNRSGQILNQTFPFDEDEDEEPWSHIDCTSSIRPFDPIVHKTHYRVGAHAIRGFDAAVKEYNLTFSEYLTKTAGRRFDPPITFEMVPVDYDGLFSAVERKEIDFFHANPGIYSCVGVEHGAQPLVTIVSKLRVRGHEYELDVFGGVIFARADNHAIRNIQDLRDKIIGAGAISQIMAGQMQFYEMKLNGMSYIMDPRQVVFAYNQYDVVDGVLSGQFDVGFVRTDTIERHVDADGNLINPDLFKIIEPKIYVLDDGQVFPFLHSTGILPEWPVAALRHVDSDVALEVQQALLALKEHASAAKEWEESGEWNPRRCDTTPALASLALNATLNGKLAGFRTSRSYFDVRTMHQAAGFLSQGENGQWKCTRGDTLYESITCPVDHYKVSYEGYKHQCSRMGLPCKEGYDCYCRPCVRIVEEENFEYTQAVVASTAVVFVVAILAFFFYRYKMKKSDELWMIQAEELRFDDPVEVIGDGSFGVVLLAEYRGTKVAIKQAIKPKQNGSRHSGSNIKSPNRSTSGSSDESDESPQPIESPQEDVDENGFLSAVASDNIGSFTFLDKGYFRDSKKRSWWPWGKHRGGASAFEEVISKTHGNSSSHGMSSFKVLGCCFGDSLEKREFIAEMRVLSRLRHPAITTVMGAVIGHSHRHQPMLVMEYMEYGSLYTLLRNETMHFSGEVILPIIRQITQGLRFLHSSKPPVLHGDLKSRNILIDSRLRAKLCDFGLSVKKKNVISGTPYWLAPEYLRGQTDYNAACDVYAFSIILYEVYARKNPYEGEPFRQTLRAICDRRVNKRPKIPQECPQKVADIMKKCWSPDPIMRPEAKDLDNILSDMSLGDAEPLTLAQQNHAVRKERATGDMLYEIFPRHIADALKAGKRVEPENHDMVTIIFSDIVKFTTISGEISPLKVSQMLDRLYLAFDRCAQKHGVFKVETIGDAYMGTTNLLKENRQEHTHMKQAAEFALDMIEEANKILIDEDDHNKGYINIRVGIHSGPVVSNVIGSLNPRYGLFGDTVNTANRMESNSMANRILCSEKSYNLLKEQAPDMAAVKRGKIHVKGKGDMVVYWVGGKQQQEGAPESDSASTIDAKNKSKRVGFAETIETTAMAPETKTSQNWRRELGTKLANLEGVGDEGAALEKIGTATKEFPKETAKETAPVVGDDMV